MGSSYFTPFPWHSTILGIVNWRGTTLPFAPAAAFAGGFPSNNLLPNTQSPEQHSRLTIPEGYSTGFYFKVVSLILKYLGVCTAVSWGLPGIFPACPMAKSIMPSSTVHSPCLSPLPSIAPERLFCLSFQHHCFGITTEEDPVVVGRKWTHH